MRHELFRFAGHHIPRSALLVTRSDLGTHTGIIYRDDNDELQLLEFYLGGQIVSRPWGGRHPHVVLDTDDDDKLAYLNGLCQVIAQRYSGRLPEHLFSFRRSPEAFINMTTGELNLGDAIGASCASFVLLVLSMSDIDLVVTDRDWPYRQSDFDRVAQLAPALQREYSGRPDDLVKILTEIPSPRVAPEEVVGAAMCPDPPATQAFAERAGKWVIGLFDHNADFLDERGNLRLPSPP